MQIQNSRASSANGYQLAKEKYRKSNLAFQEAYLRKKFRGYINDASFDKLLPLLARVNLTLHEPLMQYQYRRDIDIPPVGIEDNQYIYFLNRFGGSGTATMEGISYANPTQTVSPVIGLDRADYATPLRKWQHAIQYKTYDLKAFEKIGQPLIAQLTSGIKKLFEMQMDKVVYRGDSDSGLYPAYTGLLNSENNTFLSSPITQYNFTDPLVTDTPDYQVIFKQITNWLMSIYETNGYTYFPRKILMSESVMNYLALQQPPSVTAWAHDLLEYLSFNLDAYAKKKNGVGLEILATKWLEDDWTNAVGGRMVAYTQDPELLAFPMLPLMPENAVPIDVGYRIPYIANFGQVTFIRPETIGYANNIGIPTA